MQVSVVIPVLVKEPALSRTLDRLASLRSTIDLEILIVVDVPESDRYEEALAANESAALTAGARTIYRQNRRGFGSALREGFADATGDVVVPVMGDDSDDLELIGEFLTAIRDGCDVVAGSRYMKGGRTVGNSTKQRVSHIYSMMMRMAGGPPIHDVSNSFKAYRREVLATINPIADSFDLSVELAVKAHIAGFCVCEIPATWTNRTAGRSNFVFRREFLLYSRWLTFAATRRLLHRHPRERKH